MARAVYLGFALAAAGLLLTAAGLTPAPAGLGTHRQLGLPACGFLKATGLPCPSCGLTTSFALGARGRLSDAAQLHPFGFVLFFSVVASVPLSLVAAYRRTPLRAVFDPGRAMTALRAAGSLYLAVWFVRIYL
jgi:hypothetical protein